MKPEIFVQYQQTPGFLASARKEFYRKVWGLPSWTGWVASWAVITFLALAGTRRSPIPGLSRLQYLLAFAAVTAALLGLLRLKARRVSEVEKPSEKIEFRFTELAIEKSTGVSRTRMDWMALVHFLEGGEFFFLMYPNKTAEAIPKSAFSSTAGLAAFRSLLLTKLSQWKERDHPIFGKTHPAVYLVLLVVIGLVLWQARNIASPDLPTISVTDYEKRKEDVVEVWITSEGGLMASIFKSQGRSGTIQEHFRVAIPSAQLGNRGLLDRLTEGLPHSAIHDERQR